MATAIYKPSQGYWTRIMTAVGVGMIVLAGIGWLWGQLSAVGTTTTMSYKYPDIVAGVDTWAHAVNNPAAALTVLGGVTTDRPSKQGTPNQVILSDKNTRKTYTLTRDEFAAALNAARQNLPEGASIFQLSGPDIASVVDKQDRQDKTVDVWVTTFAARNRIYIQGGVSVVLAFATILFLRWFYRSPKIGDFMIATEAEMRKVSWPSRQEIYGSTVVVVIGTFMMAMLLLAVDVFFTKFFIWIKVLAAT